MATCELGQAMRRRGAPFALVQEPYFSNGAVRGLPGDARVYSDLVGRSAVVVDDRTLTCMVVSCSEWGVCVSVEGRFGRLLLASIYCRFGCALEPYIRYMDTVLLLASGTPVILGLDANACSSMWFSKMLRNTPGHQNYIRGEMLGEWLLTSGASVLNEASELYTFDGPMGASDIDLTLASDMVFGRFNVRWKVCDNGGISDHNLIEIVLVFRTLVQAPEPPRRWRLKDVNWEEYGRCFREAALSQPIGAFRELSLDEQVGQLDRWMCRVNDTQLGRSVTSTPRRLRWWTRELDVMLRRVRFLRKRFQRAKRSNSDQTAVRRSEHLAALSLFKGKILEAKERDWRNFIRDDRDNPWGNAYRICRGRRREQDIEALVDGGSR